VHTCVWLCDAADVHTCVRLCDAGDVHTCVWLCGAVIIIHVYVIVRTCCYSAHVHVLMCRRYAHVHVITWHNYCYAHVCCCATLRRSDSTDKCNIVMTCWYQIYASEHNEEGTFLLFESVHFLFFKHFWILLVGPSVGELNLVWPSVGE